MQARWPQEEPTPEAPRRLAWALALSLAVHALLVASLQAGLPQRAAGAATAIEVRIGPTAAEPPAREDARETPAPMRHDAAAMRPTAESFSIAPAQAPSAKPAAPSEAGNAQAPDTAAAALTAVHDSVYHVITALDRPPVPLMPPDGCYPGGARGEVAYELLIDENGVVKQAVVLSVQPLELSTAAAEALCAAVRFAPAVKDGRAVKSKVRFVVGRADAVSTRE